MPELTVPLDPQAPRVMQALTVLTEKQVLQAQPDLKVILVLKDQLGLQELRATRAMSVKLELKVRPDQPGLKALRDWSELPGQQGLKALQGLPDPRVTKEPLAM